MPPLLTSMANRYIPDEIFFFTNISNNTMDTSDLSINSMDINDLRGVVTNDASICMEYRTRGQAQKTLASVDKVKKWLDSPEEQEQLQLEAVDPILGFISNDPLIARGIYNASDFKARLTEFIAEGQREAKELEERLASANIDIKSTELISFSKVNKKYLQDRMNVSFHDAAAKFSRDRARLMCITNTLHKSGYYETVHIPELKVRRNATTPIFTVTSSNNKSPRHIPITHLADKDLL